MRRLGHAVGFHHRRAEHRLELASTCGGSDDDDERMKRSWLRAMIVAGCAAARARIAWCIVGTAVYQLGLHVIAARRRI